MNTKKQLNDLLNILMYAVAVVLIYAIIIFISSHFGNIFGFIVFLAGLSALTFIIMNLTYVRFIGVK